MDTSDEGTLVEDSFLYEHIFVISTHSSWYVDISNYIATWRVPQHFPYREQWIIIHHSARYSWIEKNLFYIISAQKILCCISEDDIYDVLKYAHDGACGGHFADKRIGHKVLQMGYYWPPIFFIQGNVLEGAIVANECVSLVG